MKITTILAYSAVAVSFAIVASSLLSSTNAFAYLFGGGSSFSNSLSQAITQSQSADQKSTISSTTGAIGLSGNNVALLLQSNTGNLTGLQAFQ